MVFIPVYNNNKIELRETDKIHLGLGASQEENKYNNSNTSSQLSKQQNTLTLRL